MLLGKLCAVCGERNARREVADRGPDLREEGCNRFRAECEVQREESRSREAQAAPQGGSTARGGVSVRGVIQERLTVAVIAAMSIVSRLRSAGRLSGMKRARSASRRVQRPVQSAPSSPQAAPKSIMKGICRGRLAVGLARQKAGAAWGARRMAAAAGRRCLPILNALCLSLVTRSAHSPPMCGTCRKVGREGGLGWKQCAGQAGSKRSNRRQSAEAGLFYPAIARSIFHV
jgi:hypothetical protein